MDVPEVRYARNGDIALAYQVVGDGPVDLVFLPGFVHNLEITWEHPASARFLRRLSSFSRLILTDRRGTGLSDRLSPQDLPPLEVLMDDLGVVLDAVGSERTVVFGFSDAGCVCALFAATYPERTIGLIAYDTAARGTAAPDFPWQWSEAEWEPYFEELAARWGTTDYARETMAWFNPSFKGDERTVAWWARMQRLAASPNSAVAIERIWHEIDVRPVLPTIRVPTLVMHRREDAIEEIGAGRDFAQRIPGARLVELDGADNAPWAGDQDAVLDEIERFIGRVRDDEADLDRVLATVLFTDIVSSTAKASELGDRRWHELLERHHAEVRTHLSRYRGREVDTAGDGFLATFDGPARAVRCALAIAEGVRQLGLEIRAGIHTGEVQMDGDDVRGIAVHVGARVGAIAGASEVLVSSTVKDLVAGSGLAFEDAGEHELKGVPDRWRLYRVVG
jgi:class 3 adenylate cyclase